MNLQLKKAFEEKERELLEKMNPEERELYLNQKDQFNRVKFVMLNWLDSKEENTESYLRARNWYDRNITTEKKLDRLIEILSELSRIRSLRESVLD